MGKQASQGSTSENSAKSPNNQQRGLFSTVSRELLGQMAAPPDTAISTPLQQGISNLQAGFPQMRQNFGLGGGLVDQLAGNHAATGGGAMAAGPNQWGLQSREQLGLPDRSSYFTFRPTPDQLSALGAVPPITAPPGSGKQRKAFDRLTADDTRTPQQDARLARLTKNHPEWNGGGSQ